MSLRERSVWVLVFAVALGYFVVRGPLRAIQPDGHLDFRVIHTALAVYDSGGNPYQEEDVQAYLAETGASWILAGFANVRLLYPPPFLTLFGPLGGLDLAAASAVWLLIELFALVALVAASGRLARLSTVRAWAGLAAAALAMAPVHTSISQGQPGTLFALFTAACFLWLSKPARARFGALALAAALLKPSFGAPAVPLVLMQGRWRSVAAAVATLGLLSAPFLVDHGVANGIDSYSSALTAVSRPGGDADPTAANPNRFDLINLQSWLGSWPLPSTLAAPATLVLLAAVYWVLWKRRDQADQPDTAGVYWTLAALGTLLAVYHRAYDATLLLVACAAAAKLFELGRIKDALSIALPLSVFAVPGAAALRSMLPDTAGGWAEAILIRHPVVALLLLTATSARLLLQADARRSSG